MNIKLIKHLAKSDGVSKGVLRVENRVVKETTDILKRLTPKNQSYFMTSEKDGTSGSDPGVRAAG